MTPQFFTAVSLLRSLPGHERVMALHAALNWSDEKLEAAEHSEATARAAVSALASDIASAANVVVLETRRGLA